MAARFEEEMAARFGMKLGQFVGVGHSLQIVLDTPEGQAFVADLLIDGLEECLLKGIGACLERSSKARAMKQAYNTAYIATLDETARTMHTPPTPLELFRCGAQLKGKQLAQGSVQHFSREFSNTIKKSHSDYRAVLIRELAAKTVKTRTEADESSTDAESDSAPKSKRARPAVDVLRTRLAASEQRVAASEQRVASAEQREESLKKTVQVRVYG
jgi:hypothetical protein